MPEGPEVETVIRSIKNKLINQKILDVNILYPAIASNDLVGIIGQVIKDIFRCGKFIIICLDKGYLLIHLRMEGKLLFSKEKLENKHVHCIFQLSNDYMFYHDVRKFGRIGYYNCLENSPVSKLGPDALKITKEQLLENIKNKSKAIKSVLLDQSVVAGIGNIYASEICFVAKVNPFLPAKDINKDQALRLVNASHQIIKKAIELGGSSIHTFYDSDGVSGRFQNELLVYGKHNQKCPNCGSLIHKVKIDQRGSYYCECCQK